MFGLSFLYPLFLLGAAAVAIPIAIHLFRRRTESVVDFPAVRLLRRGPVEQHRRRRLRELVLLVLRVSALGLLALAFARPYFVDATAAAPIPTTVVALDTSWSLSGPGRFEAAKAAASRTVDETPATHRVALLTFDDTATVVVAATTDRTAVKTAIDAAPVTSGGTRFRTALAQAVEALQGVSGRIVVITDLQQAGWDAADEGAVPEDLSVEVLEVPPAPANLAVTTARRDGPAIVATLHNYGATAVSTPVHLRIGGRNLASQKVDALPQADAEVRFHVGLPARGGAEVRIDDPQGLHADNARYLVLDPPEAVPVIVITADPPGSSHAGLYVERALSVADEGQAFDVRVFDGRAFSALEPTRLADVGALVVLATRTLDRRGRTLVAEHLQGGGRVLLTLGPEVDVATLGDTVGQSLGVGSQVVSVSGGPVTLIAVDARHPIFRPFSAPGAALGDLRVTRYRPLSADNSSTVLARFSDGATAMTEQAVGDGRLLIFASDVENQWNRLPLSPAFVPWSIETVRYLTQARVRRQEYVIPDIPRGVPRTPGVYTVDPARSISSEPGPAMPATPASGAFLAAVNVDIRESNPARISAAEFLAAITRRGRRETAAQAQLDVQLEEQQRLWQLGLAVMLAALVAEGLIGRRAS
ncbi:MAG: BatA domain-containing protein [Acidobacteriota bacterium]